MLFITSSKTSQTGNEIVKFWAAEATKIVTIMYLQKNSDVSKKIAKYESFDKKIDATLVLQAQHWQAMKY